MKFVKPTNDVAFKKIFGDEQKSGDREIKYTGIPAYEVDRLIEIA